MKFRNYLETIAGVGVYPVTTLLIFFIFFTILAIWAFRARKQHLDAISRMPLEAEHQTDINPLN